MARDDLRKIYGVSLLFGAGMTATIAATAPLFSLLFQEPRLTWPIAGASLQILVGAAAIVPSALWTRDLSFRRLAKIEMAAGVTSIAATLLLACARRGCMGTRVGHVARCDRAQHDLAYVSASVCGHSSRLRGIGEHLKFGLTLVGNRVSYFVVVQSDVLIGSAFLSTTEIGQYSVALQLATLPMTKVMGTINQITLPAVAQQQGDPSRVRQAVLKSIGLISLIAFPAALGDFGGSTGTRPCPLRDQSGCRQYRR